MKRKNQTLSIGQVIGRLTVISFEQSLGRGTRLLCRCTCGTEKVLRQVDISRTDGTRSCGCLRPEKARAAHTKHGFKYHPLYAVWQAMIRRCHNPSDKNFFRYGGRGIEVCQRWRDSFTDFLTDMGPRPEGFSVERENNDGGYNPDNAIWASRSTQARNTRSTHRVTLNGQPMSLIEAAEKSAINYQTLHYRVVERGLSIEEAVSMPLRGHLGGA